MEVSTNLMGGQPFSMDNLNNVRKIADKYKIMIARGCKSYRWKRLFY